MKVIENVVNWLVDEQPNIWFIENISGFGFLFLMGVVAIMFAMIFSKKFRKIFF